MATKPAIDSAAGAPTPPRLRMLSGVAEASVDVRKACNGIKRMAAIGAASMMTRLDAKQVAGAAERMALDTLVAIGFDVSDEKRLEHVLPMMMEATSIVIADAAWHISDKANAAEELGQATKFGAKLLSDVARSRAVAKMVEPAYPGDMDSIVALRLTAASAMAQVVVEIADFDFAHPAADCVKEAGKVLVKAATEAAAKLAPEQASPASRLMLTQSLIQSAAKVYSASWRAVSGAEMGRLDAMTEAAREAALVDMEKAGLSTLLAPVNKRFAVAFGAIADTACELFERSAAEAAPAARHALKPR